MNIVRGNIWNSALSNYIVIPTNIGWTSGYYNIMGAGLAKEAKIRYRGIEKYYGEICLLFKEDTGLRYYFNGTPRLHPLILFPTKPLNKKYPHLSWQNKSDIVLIENGLIQLSVLRNYEISLPMVGCGNGGLSETEVLPLIIKYLGDKENVTLYRSEGK